MKKLSFLLFLSLSLSSVSKGDEVYTFIVKKQEEKKLSRWTLAEWLATKDRMKMMDMWLALHTPTPYEFILGGAEQLGNPKVGGHYTAGKFEATAYASIFGLSFQREFDPVNRTLALFNFRIFGYHAQGPNITLHLGVRSQSDPGPLRSMVGGASLSMYLAKFFGVDALWRHFFDAAPNSKGLTLSGNRFEGGAFIEYDFLRLYGNYFTESVISNTGTEWGIKFFF